MSLNSTIQKGRKAAQQISNARKFTGNKPQPPPDTPNGSLAGNNLKTGTLSSNNASRGSTLDEINALYAGIRNSPSPKDFRRPGRRFGLSGAELNPDGSDPGNALDRFQKQNSEEAVLGRIARTDREHTARGQRYASAGQTAVAERKNLQAMGEAPFQQQQRFDDAQRVKSDDGYMTIFNGKGKAVGTNRPMPRADSFDGLGPTNPQNAQLGGLIQDSVRQGNGYGGFSNSAPQQVQGPPAPSFLDQSPPSGGTGGRALVGPPPGQGAPGGGDPSVVQQPEAWKAALRGLPQFNPFEGRNSIADPLELYGFSPTVQLAPDTAIPDWPVGPSEPSALPNPQASAADFLLPPAPPKAYDYIFPGMQFPQTGTLGQKELARRAYAPLVPSMMNKIQTGLQDAHVVNEDILRYLFGIGGPQIASEYR